MVYCTESEISAIYLLFIDLTVHKPLKKLKSWILYGSKNLQVFFEFLGSQFPWIKFYIFSI